MNQQLAKKRESLTKEIRRKGKQQELQVYRKRIIQSLETLAQKPLKSHAQLIQDRQKLQYLAIQLRGDPTPVWKSIILQLRSVCQGHSDFSYIINLCILKQIVIVFDKQFLDLGLSKIAASLLNFIVFSSRQGTSSVTRALQSYGLVTKLLQTIKSCKILEQKVQQLYLIGNMLSQNGYIRNIFVKQEWLQILLSLSSHQNMPIELQQIIVWLINNTVIYYDQPQYNLKFRLSSIFLEVLSDYLNKDVNDKMKKDILCALYNLSMPGNTADVVKIASYDGILNHIIKQSQSKNQYVCYQAWKVLALFVQFNQNTLGISMIKNNIHILAYKILLSTPSRKVKNMICQFIWKLTKKSKSNSELLASSCLLELILQKCYPRFDEKTRSNNIFLLKSIVCELQYYSLQQLLKKVNIIQPIMLNLSMRQNSINILDFCLQTVLRLINVYKNVYTPNNSNRMIIILQSQFRASTILSEIMNEHPNEYISNKANDVFSEIAETYD